VYTVKKHYTGINIFFKKSQVKHDWKHSKLFGVVSKQKE
jgi:hypothetical protein